MNLQTVAVIGAGTMGAGIAQWFTQEKIQVQLVDANEAQLLKAKNQIHESWDKLLQKNKYTEAQVDLMKKNLTFCNQENLLKNTDLVIEAIVENLEIKKSLFTSLDLFFDSNTVFASNTSSFPITDLSEGVSPKRREQFLGLHFFNPAPIMKLVEIIPGAETNPFLARNFYQWFEAHDKKPALSKDSPGFIVNRVARNFYGEPLRIVNTADENKMREVDQVLKEVGGFKMGPFELMDLIGIDINYSVTLSVWNAFDQNSRFAPHPLQKQMVTLNRLGRKTKKGFYSYE